MNILVIASYIIVGQFAWKVILLIVTLAIKTVKEV